MFGRKKKKSTIGAGVEIGQNTLIEVERIRQESDPRPSHMPGEPLPRQALDVGTDYLLQALSNLAEAGNSAANTILDTIAADPNAVTAVGAVGLIGWLTAQHVTSGAERRRFKRIEKQAAKQAKKQPSPQLRFQPLDMSHLDKRDMELIEEILMRRALSEGQ